MPLKLEIYGPDGSWIEIGKVKPGDLPGSISDNKPDGSRDIYIFGCLLDDSKSVIYRSKAGLDGEIGLVRVLTSADLETVAELKRGDTHEMRIKTDRSPEERRIRFTHI